MTTLPHLRGLPDGAIIIRQGLHTDWTDHFILKYVFDQRIPTPFQSKWLPKLLGFDYQIENKQGKDNVVADALSRIQRQGEFLTILTALTSNEFMDTITSMWTTNPVLSDIIKNLQDGSLVTSKYTWQGDQLKRKGKWVVGPDEQLRKRMEFSKRIVLDEIRLVWILLIVKVDEGDSATNTTPFEMIYVQPPPLHIPYMSKDSRVELVDMTLTAREKAIDMLKFNLIKAQNRMKLIVRKGRQHKLSTKFYGLFLVLAKIGQVAYKLQLPSNAKVHPIFHVSQLKKCLNPNVSIGVFHECDAQGLLAAEPFNLLERKIVKQQNRMGVFGLIQWSDGFEEDTTWEDLADLTKRFPAFVLDP
ncbi:hypothetical protein Tco_1367836 [Tanacetum coccineum]